MKWYTECKCKQCVKRGGLLRIYGNRRQKLILVEALERWLHENSFAIKATEVAKASLTGTSLASLSAMHQKSNG